MPLIDPTVALSTRQEAFCRHYAVSGNAADAARQAGYSERSARQTGCALLERPYIVERGAPHPPVVEAHRTGRGPHRACPAGAGLGRPPSPAARPT